jgi:hypothetical protein
MGILVDGVDAPCVERARASDDPIDLVAFLEKKFGQIRPVLAGNAGEQRFLHVSLLYDNN